MKKSYYEEMAEINRRLDEQVEQMEAREEKCRKENGYDYVVPARLGQIARERMKSQAS